ncbi:MAG: hypothetical protein WD407_03640 [Rhodospirillales bacterium]
MCHKILFFFSSFLFVIALFASSASSAPRACHDLSRDGGLPNKDGRIISKKITFHKNSKKYPVRTYSDSENSGQHTSEWCFRYEVENVGKKDISNFYWGLGGIRVDPFKPGRKFRESKVKATPILYDPLDRPSDIYAFKNLRESTRAWMESKNLSQATHSKKYYIPFSAILSHASVDPKLPDLLKKHNLSESPIMSFDFSVPGVKTQLLQERINGPGYQLFVSSYAMREKNQAVIHTTISAKGSASKSTDYYMPSFTALTETKNASDLKSYSRFISLFQELSYRPRKFQPKWSFVTTIQIDKLKRGKVFLTNHPITLIHSGVKHCYRVISYSIFALDFGLRQCPGMEM